MELLVYIVTDLTRSYAVHSYAHGLVPTVAETQIESPYGPARSILDPYLAADDEFLRTVRNGGLSEQHAPCLLYQPLRRES
jgi:hypothetical protein